ncbi:prepilin-type N-terminal cleavage/methylation domain-containing protein [Candidatus Gottesmanbacteria bacterium]|nr:prepilin-type N-terminal cleavage/methylation domain-containing protein [Candidatus Gottesmanbacteria bacterium]
MTKNFQFSIFNFQFKKLISLFLTTGDAIGARSQTKMYRSLGYLSGRTRKFKSNLLGFTLVELLVVIGIIAMVMVAVFPNFTGARQRARDNQRKIDLKNIQGALDLYKSDQNPPAYPTGSLGSSLCQVCWSSDGTCGTGANSNIYMRKFPCDPQNIANPTPYLYTLNASDNLKYTIIACLENPVDPDKDTSNATGCTTSYTVHEP